MAVPLILGGLAAANSLAKWFGAGKQEKQLNNLINNTGEYTADPEVAGNLALSKNFFNGRSGATGLAEQLILGNQANTTASAERNATDAGQVLAAASAAQGNTNSAIVDLAERERQDQAGRMGVLQNAVTMSNNERGKVWADRMRKLNMLLGTKTTKYANKDSAFDGVASGLGMALGSQKDDRGLADLLGFYK